MARLGIISDTHNYLDPRLPELFAGVDHILHGGDVGLPWLIMELERVAPVTVVSGNTDVGLPYHETEVLKLAGRKFLVHHIVDPARPVEGIRRRLLRERPDVVVFGHTHRAFEKTVEGTLYLNPGYAGQPRFNQPRSVAILYCDEHELRTEFCPLP